MVRTRFCCGFFKFAVSFCHLASVAAMRSAVVQVLALYFSAVKQWSNCFSLFRGIVSTLCVVLSRCASVPPLATQGRHFFHWCVAAAQRHSNIVFHFGVAAGAVPISVSRSLRDVIVICCFQKWIVLSVRIRGFEAKFGQNQTSTMRTRTTNRRRVSKIQGLKTSADFSRFRA